MTVPVPDQLEFISVADGVTRDFPYPKRFLQADEIKVLLRDVYGVDTPQYLGQHFGIAGSSWPNGGAVSFYTAPPSGSSIVRYRATQAKQTADLENKQRNDAKAVEVQLDRLAMIGQDVQASNARGLRFPVGDMPNALPPKSKRAGKILSFDANGQPEAAVTKVDVEIVANIAGNVSIVAGIAPDVTAVAANKTNINKVAAIDMAVTSVAEIASDILTVVIMRPNIETVVSEKANISTVASHIGNVNKVAAIDQAVTKVAAIDADVSKVSGISADVTKVSSIAPAVTTVADDRLTIAAVAANETNIDAVAANKAHIDTVAGISSQVSNVSAISADVTAVAGVAISVPIVAGIDDEVVAVAAIAAKVVAVDANKTNIDAVAGNKTNIDAVKNNATNINAVAADKANIDIVASSKTDIGTVAANITAVNNASDNMPAIIAAPTKAQEAAQSAEDAAESKRRAELVTALMKGGTIGQLFIKIGNGDYEYGWADPSAGGDMFKLNYDPQGINADAFSMAFMTETANAKIMTNAERIKVAASTSNTGTVTSVAVAVPTGFTVTPAITTSGTITIGNASGYQAYTTAEAQKLNGIDLSLYQALSQKNAVNGYAGLDASGKLSENQLPAIAISDVFEAPSQAAMLALTAENGDICVRSDLNKSFILKLRPATTLANWIELRTPTDAVLSVIGLGGAISRDDLRTKLELGSAAYSAATAFATAAQFTALSTDKLNKDAQAADSAMLGNETAAQWQAKIDAKAGFYSGGDANEVNLPIGSSVMCWGINGVPRNGLVTLRQSGNNSEYTGGASGVLMSGIWRLDSSFAYAADKVGKVRRIS